MCLPITTLEFCTCDKSSARHTSDLGFRSFFETPKEEQSNPGAAEGSVFVRDVAWTYVGPWKRFHAEQRVLAERADARLHGARKCPVLQDVAEIRVWFVAGAQRSGRVQSDLIPVLRRAPTYEASRGPLPLMVAWQILRFVGVMDFADAVSVAVVGTEQELA